MHAHTYTDKCMLVPNTREKKINTWAYMRLQAKKYLTENKIAINLPFAFTVPQNIKVIFCPKPNLVIKIHC